MPGDFGDLPFDYRFGGGGGMPSGLPSWFSGNGGLLNGMPSALGFAPSSPDVTGIPPTATPTVGETPPSATPPATGSAESSTPGTSLLDRISKAINRNPNTLLAMAAGFAGAPSIGAGMSRAFAGASNPNTGLAADQKMGMNARAEQALGVTYKALVQAGVPPQQAMAAVAAFQAGNGSLLQGLAQKHFAPPQLVGQTAGMQLVNPNNNSVASPAAPKFEVIDEDMFGNKRRGLVNEWKGTVTPASPGVPTGISSLPEQQQYQQFVQTHQEGSRYQLPGSNRVITWRGGKMVYEDTGQPVSQ